MILEFSIENFRSFADKVTFSMVNRDTKSDQTQPVYKIGHIEYLTSAVIYGPNASGKSNFVKALLALQSLVLNSARYRSSDEIEEHDAFAFDAEMEEEPTTFEITFIVKGVKYYYRISYDYKYILEEELCVYPNHRKTLLFHRTTTEKGKDAYKFGERLKGRKKDVQYLTNFKQAYLSKGAENRMEQLEAIVDYFEHDFLLSWTINNPYEHRLLEEVLEEIYQEPEGFLYRNFLLLLKSFDTGILDIEVKKEKNIKILEDGQKFRSKYRVYTFHKSFDGEDNEKAFEEAFPLEQESTGTQRLFVLASMIVPALMKGKVVVIDEFDQSLHPLISSFIVEVFNNPEINVKGAQLIVVTHATEILNRDEGLRRDQIWFVEKNEDGVSDIFSLFDVDGVRQNVPFDKWYLTGRFGSMPAVTKFNFQQKFEHA